MHRFESELLDQQTAGKYKLGDATKDFETAYDYSTIFSALNAEDQAIWRAETLKCWGQCLLEQGEDSYEDALDKLKESEEIWDKIAVQRHNVSAPSTSFIDFELALARTALMSAGFSRHADVWKSFTTKLLSDTAETGDKWSQVRKNLQKAVAELSSEKLKT